MIFMWQKAQFFLYRLHFRFLPIFTLLRNGNPKKLGENKILFAEITEVPPCSSRQPETRDSSS